MLGVISNLTTVIQKYCTKVSINTNQKFNQVMTRMEKIEENNIIAVEDVKSQVQIIQSHLDNMQHIQDDRYKEMQEQMKHNTNRLIQAIRELKK